MVATKKWEYHSLLLKAEMVKRIVCSVLLVLLLSCKAEHTADKVAVHGRSLLVNRKPYVIKGICYHPVPVGSDARSFVTLSQDLALMKEAGINTIRVYEPITEKAVLDQIAAEGFKVITGFGYNQEGVYDMLSGSFIDYVEKYKNHKAILMWELGNEYNYHPKWFNNDIANWYSVLNTSAKLIQAADDQHPVATAHGELPDALAMSLCPNIEVWGMNVYRWDNPSALFEQWKAMSDKPMYLSEAGGDSYMTATKNGYEAGSNEKAQADANSKILQSVFDNSDVCSGVALFSFTDGWWKAGNNKVQDVGGIAPSSTGVPYDGTPNEEYWGIVDINRKKKATFDVVRKKYQGAEVKE